MRYMPLLRGVRLTSDESSCPIVDTTQYENIGACESALQTLLQQVGGAAAVQCFGPSENWIAETDEVACTTSPKPSQRDPRFAIGAILAVAGAFVLLAGCGAGACVYCDAV